MNNYNKINNLTRNLWGLQIFYTISIYLEKT
jgi:hypothetical protein